MGSPCFVAGKGHACGLKIPLGAAATVTPAWTGPWLRLNLGPA